jgi:hypothetical protein
VSAEEAELLIQGQAFSAGRPMRAVAQAILDGREPFIRAGNTIEDQQ